MIIMPIITIIISTAKTIHNARPGVWRTPEHILQLYRWATKSSWEDNFKIISCQSKKICLEKIWQLGRWRRWSLPMVGNNQRGKKRGLRRGTSIELLWRDQKISAKFFRRDQYWVVRVPNPLALEVGRGTCPSIELLRRDRYWAEIRISTNQYGAETSDQCWAEIGIQWLVLLVCEEILVKQIWKMNFKTQSSVVKMEEK